MSEIETESDADTDTEIEIDIEADTGTDTDEVLCPRLGLCLADIVTVTEMGRLLLILTQ